MIRCYTHAFTALAKDENEIIELIHGVHFGILIVTEEE